MRENKYISTKILALLVAVVLLVSAAAGGTIAWLMAKTDPVVNTFVSGDINITLTEPSFDSSQIYKAIPGDVIQKDPTVTVLKGSEDCYVRVFVINWWTTETDKHFRGTEAAGWYDFNSSKWTPTASYVDETSDAVLGHVFEFTYNGRVTTTETADTVLTPPFTTITVPDWITGAKYASLDNYKVIVLAQAVQAEGFASAAEAFEEAGYPTGTVTLENGVTTTIAQMIDTLKAQSQAEGE